MTDPRPLTEEERQAMRAAADKAPDNPALRWLRQALDLLEHAEGRAEQAEARAAEWKESAERLEARAIRAEARFRGVFEFYSPPTIAGVESGTEEHEAYADPIAGGWDGYQAACHDCDWRAPTIHPTGSAGKDAAREEAIAHRKSGSGTEERA